MNHKGDPNKQDRGSPEAIPGRCGAKLRKSDPPRYCKGNPVAGKKRCRQHGGATPGGIASPHLKTGKHSRYLPHLPAKWVDRYSADDPDLVSLQHELELNVMAIRVLFDSQQKVARPNIGRFYKQLEPMLNLHQKLVGVESRRLREQQELVQRSQFARFAQAIVLSVATHVSDPKVKALIQADVMRFLGLAAPPILKGDAA